MNRSYLKFGRVPGFQLLLMAVLAIPSFSAFSQTRQPSLVEIDRGFQLDQKEADVRIQSYLIRNPQARISFYQNGAAHLLVDVNEHGIPLYLKTDNSVVATSLNVQQLRTGGSLGINILGTGMRLGTWDGGKVRSDHVELINRVIQVDGAATLDDHATHTSGTMLATGINLLAKGMAPEATLIAYDFNNDVSEMVSQAKPDQTSLLLSNHSYGNAAGWEYDGSKWTWNGDPAIDPNVDYKFGYYDTKSNQWDGIAFNAPYYLMVKSAGNDRSDTGDGTKPPDGPFDCISTFGVAKNILCVGAVNKLFSPYTGPNDVLITSFSSYGPTDDGRIKPDIVAPGLNVISSVSTATNAYSSFSGTSMATPATTGTLALLQQLYKSLNSGNFMRSATLKAIALHTAREAGANPGPDYSFGWGLLDAEAAAKVIINKDNQNIFIQEAVLTSGQAFELNLTPKAGTKITATLVWTDPAGIPVAPALNPTKLMLVNDLDLRLVDDGGTQQLPWILNPASPAAAATTGDNVRDNVEKIEFASALPRSYKLRVTNKGTLQGGIQAFSLILTYTSVVDPLVTYYWIKDSGSWNDGTHWSLTSGGAAANAVPAANHRVVFDEKSFSVANATVTLNANQNCYSVRWFGNQFATNISLNSNTLTIGEGMTLLTTKVTATTPGTISFASANTTANAVDLNSNALNKWALSFTGSSSWAITGTASIDKLTIAQGTVSFNGAGLHLNQLAASGTASKTIALVSSSLQALASLSVDFTGMTINSDNLSSIIVSPAVVNSINVAAGNFQGLVSMQNGDASITGTGQVRSIQGNGIVRLNGTLLVPNISLSGGSQLILQQGATQTFTDKFTFATSSTSRVVIKSSGIAAATLAFNGYYKICLDFIDVQSVNVSGTSVVNAGAGSTVTSSLNWLKLNCSDIVFPDFTFSYPCIKSSTYFIDNSSGPIVSRVWAFGDPASGTQNTSPLLNPVHYYSTAGPFTAKLTVTGASGSNSISKTITLQSNDLADNTVQLNNGNLISTVLATGYQWLKDGQLIDGATSRSYTFQSTPGEYSVLIFNTNCNKRSDPFLITAIEDNTPVRQQNVKIYPNPTSDFFQIESNDAILATYIMDAVGRELRLEAEPMDAGRYRVNVSAIPTGLYILKISTREKTDFQKVIIRK